MGVAHALLWFYVAIFSSYALFVISGALLPRAPGRGGGDLPSLGIVVPAYNEQAHLPCIGEAVSMAKKLGAPIVVVDDGSRDGSAEALAHLCRTGGALLVRHAVNRGKAAALNSGIAALGTEFVLTLDADTRVSADSIVTALAAIRPDIGAVIIIVDGSGVTAWAQAQATEYRWLFFERAALARYGLVFTVPGSASLWRRDALAGIGGFSCRTCAEDTDATIALSLAGWRIAVAPESLALTDCPPRLIGLLKQRRRWIWGSIQAACYVLAEVANRRPTTASINALAFAAVTLFSVFGFGLTVSIMWRLVVGGLGRGDALAGATLIGVTLLRLWVAQRTNRKKAGFVPIIAILARLTAVQMVNNAAFWYGLATSRALPRRDHPLW